MSPSGDVLDPYGVAKFWSNVVVGRYRKKKTDVGSKS